MIARQMNRRPMRPAGRMQAQTPNEAMLRQTPEAETAPVEAEAAEKPRESLYRVCQAVPDQLVQPTEGVLWTVADRGNEQALAAEQGNQLVLLNMTFTTEADGQGVLSLYAGEQVIFSASYKLWAYQPVTVVFNGRAETTAGEDFILRNDSPDALIIQQASFNILNMN